MQDKTRTLESRLEESRIRTTDLQKDIESLRLESVTDPLTLLGNRHCFDQSLVTMTAEAVASRQPLSLLLADIDHFKRFNDSFGHQIGDQVLRLVGSTIKDSLRDSDVSARYGGENLPSSCPAHRSPSVKRRQSAFAWRSWQE